MWVMGLNIRRQLAAAMAVAGLMTMAPVASKASLIFYSDRPSFDAAEPLLSIQSFNSANLYNQSYVFEANGLNSATNDAIFAAGSILPGLTLTDPQPGSQTQALIVYGGGPVGSGSVGDAWFDALDLSFTPGVYAVAEDAFANTAASASFAGSITEEVFSGTKSLGSETLSEALGGSMFFGVASTTLPITKVELIWYGNGDGVSFVSNIAFGTAAAVAPEPSTLTLSALAAVLLGLGIAVPIAGGRHNRKFSVLWDGRVGQNLVRSEGSPPRSVRWRSG